MLAEKSDAERQRAAIAALHASFQDDWLADRADEETVFPVRQDFGVDRAREVQTRYQRQMAELTGETVVVAAELPFTAAPPMQSAWSVEQAPAPRQSRSVPPDDARALVSQALALMARLVDVLVQLEGVVG